MISTMDMIFSINRLMIICGLSGLLLTAGDSHAGPGPMDRNTTWETIGIEKPVAEKSDSLSGQTIEFKHSGERYVIAADSISVSPSGVRASGHLVMMIGDSDVRYYSRGIVFVSARWFGLSVLARGSEGRAPIERAKRRLTWIRTLTKTQGEQADARQPTTDEESKSKEREKPKPESEGRSQ